MQFDIQAFEVNEDGIAKPKIRPRAITGYELGLQRVVISIGSFRNSDSLYPQRGILYWDLLNPDKRIVAAQLSAEGNAALLAQHNPYYPRTAWVQGIKSLGTIVSGDTLYWLVEAYVGGEGTPRSLAIQFG